MPRVVCAVCLAQRKQEKGEPYINVGYVTMVEGTYYCDQHLPKTFTSLAKKLPPWKPPKEEKPVTRPRGRPKKVIE